MEPDRRSVGVGRVLTGATLFLFGAAAATGVVVHGDALLAAVGLVVGFVGGVYARYYRHRPPYAAQ